MTRRAGTVVLSSALFSSEEVFLDAKGVVEARGYEVSCLDGLSPAERQRECLRIVSEDRVLYVFATLQVQAALNRASKEMGAGSFPGALCNDRVLAYSAQMAVLGDILLNGHAGILPIGCLRLHLPSLRERFGQKMFVRPDTGRKLFPGQVVGTSDTDIDLFLETYRLGFDPLPLVIVDHVRPVVSEKRHFIDLARRVVVSASLYGHDGMEAGPDFDAWPALERVFDAGAHLGDELCVCDVCLLQDGSMAVVELNGFSTSGLYDCRFDKLLAAYEAYVDRWKE